jgi:glycosyltransferase 2 family protein
VCDEPDHVRADCVTWLSGAVARIVLGVVMSALCLWLALRQAPLDELLAATYEVNVWWIVPSLIGNVVSFIPRSYRWRVLLGNQGTVAEYFWAQAVGALLTNVFPLRAGEAGRVFIISRRVRLPLVQVGASLVLERAADMIVVLGLLGFLLAIMDVPWLIAATGLALLTVLGLALLGVALLALFGRQLTPLAHAIARRLPDRFCEVALSGWSSVLAALATLREPGVIFRIAFWSVVTWLCFSVAMWASIEAVVPGARLIEAMFALTAIAVGISVPSSPGFIGVLQFVGQQALVLPFPDRFTPASALTVTLVYHAVGYGVSTTLGMVGLARLGLSLGAVRKAPAAEPVPQ